MPFDKKNLPTLIHSRVAACIAKEGQGIDYQLLAEGADKIIQENLAKEKLAQRKLAHETALLIGPHVRTDTKTSAWEAYKNETW